MTVPFTLNISFYNFSEEIFALFNSGGMKLLFSRLHQIFNVNFSVVIIVFDNFQLKYLDCLTDYKQR